MIFLQMLGNGAGRVSDGFVQALMVPVTEGFQDRKLIDSVGESFEMISRVMCTKTPTFLPASRCRLTPPGPVVDQLPPLCDILEFILCL